MRRRFMSFLLAGTMVFAQIVPGNLQVYASQTPESTESVETEESVVIPDDPVTDVEYDTDQSEMEESVDEQSTESEEITIDSEKEDESVITDDFASEETDSTAAEEDTVVKEDTAAENTEEQLDTFYMITPDSSQMIQTDNQEYYYAFTPSEDGAYTFYIDGTLNNGYIEQVNEDGTNTDENGYLYEYKSYPESALTLEDCTANTTYYVKALAYSNSTSIAYVAVKKDDYASRSVSVSKITPSAQTVAYGDSYSITVKFSSLQDDFEIRDVKAYETAAYFSFPYYFPLLFGLH